jgi:hypothetical protein
MRQSGKELIAIFGMALVAACITILFFFRSEPVFAIPPGVTDIQSNSACGSESCAKRSRIRLFKHRRN